MSSTLRRIKSVGSYLLSPKTHLSNIKGISQNVQSIFQKYAIIYAFLGICYLILGILLIVNLVNELEENSNVADNWKSILVLCIYILIGILYFLLAFFSEHSNTKSTPVVSPFYQ